MKQLLIITALLLLGGCAATTETSQTKQSVDVATLQQQVFAAERAFAKTMADRDFEGFKSFLSDEVVFISGNTQRGKQNVANQWQRHYEKPTAPFSWEPKTVEVLNSGNIALSTGPVKRSSDGKVVNYYTSVWRQESPSIWKIVLDKGNKACD